MSRAQVKRATEIRQEIEALTNVLKLTERTGRGWKVVMYATDGYTRCGPPVEMTRGIEERLRRVVVQRIEYLKFELKRL